MLFHLSVCINIYGCDDNKAPLVEQAHYCTSMTFSAATTIVRAAVIENTLCKIQLNIIVIIFAFLFWFFSKAELDCGV